MKWIKMGNIFSPEGLGVDWMQAYAWVPTVEFLSPDVIRIYCGGRDHNNLTRTGFIEYDLAQKSVAKISGRPIIDLGPLGSFDDSLALACSVVSIQNRRFLYYVGWMQGKRVRYYPSIGLAVSEDGGHSFRKWSAAPIIGRTHDEPYGMASPFVLYDPDEESWQMWYASYRRWDLRGDEPWPHYELRHARSKDGINWDLSGVTCIGGADVEAIARPYVIRDSGLYQMWFSIREKFGAYRIGHARSKNGLDWCLSADPGISVSVDGWDSEMIEYPCVFDWRGDRFMLYNGNSHGRTGIGMARLQK